MPYTSDLVPQLSYAYQLLLRQYKPRQDIFLFRLLQPLFLCVHINIFSFYIFFIYFSSFLSNTFFVNIALIFLILFQHYFIFHLEFKKTPNDANYWSTKTSVINEVFWFSTVLLLLPSLEDGSPLQKWL